jgi:hypothetical protein
MGRWRQVAWFLVLLAPLAAAGEMVDRIVARVDHRVILLSEVEDTLRYEALVAGRDPNRFSADERKQALERLVDQALIEEQINSGGFVHASKEDVGRQIVEIRKQLPAASTDQGWQELLARYGLTEKDVENLVAEQADILRYVDGRFRPNIHIDKRSIETYYREQFLPKLRQSGGRVVPLDQVTDKIEEILVEERINELMNLWLRNLRLQQEVEIR